MISPSEIGRYSNERVSFSNCVKRLVVTNAILWSDLVVVCVPCCSKLGFSSVLVWKWKAYSNTKVFELKNKDVVTQCVRFEVMYGLCDTLSGGDKNHTPK